jgi:hypothetical protein
MSAILLDNGANSMTALIPDRRVAARYGVCVRTLRRWGQTLELGFPPGIRVNGRWYRDAVALDQWDNENSRRAAELRARLAAASTSTTTAI